ncbi:MAG TPA: EamA family transporter [Candidatus Nitrosotalea sp.]|jgi:DME family drug/metabolite transporter|nr:EamA family transporter [Candidatus Nitrosotalea sp.]
MLLGLLLIAIAATSWGTTGATMTLLSREAAASPLLVGWSRLAVAAPCLVLAAVGAARFGARPAGRRPWPSVSDLPLCAALGLAMAAYQVCYFRAVTLIGVAAAALLAICSAPLLIAVLAAVFLGERLSRLVRLSLGMAVAGTALLVVGPRGLGPSGLRDVAGHFGLGALLALGAGVSYAVYAVAAKGLLARVTPIAVSAITFALAAGFLAPALLTEPAPARAMAAGWPLLLYLGLGPTAVAYALFTAGLGRVPATAAGIVSLLEPLTATALGLLVFGERLGTVGFTGALLLLTALALLTRRQTTSG